MSGAKPRFDTRYLVLDTRHMGEIPHIERPGHWEQSGRTLSGLETTNAAFKAQVHGQGTSFRVMLGRRFQMRGSPELEATLRRMVVVFRFLGLDLDASPRHRDPAHRSAASTLGGVCIGSTCNSLDCAHLVHVTSPPRDIDEDIATNAPINRLTPKEREVVNLIVRGYTCRETATRLYITVKTLEKHMGSTFGKLSVASRHELAALAFEEGYVGPEKPQSNS